MSRIIASYPSLLVTCTVSVKHNYYFTSRTTGYNLLLQAGGTACVAGIFGCNLIIEIFSMPVCDLGV